MIIKALVENTALSKDFGSEHGLSLYIESNSHKILFDVGASELFLENAKKLNVDISEVDYLIVSHGHYDHGGGLRAFLRENTKAEVFIHQLAFEKYYALRLGDEREYIGLDEELKQNKRIGFTSDRFFISKGVQVFSNITRKEPLPKSNDSLLMKHDDKIVQDTFAHEQNLIIEEAGKTLLVTGCAHNGIENILEYFHDLKRRMPNYVIGGFHLSSRSSGSNEDSEMIDKISKYLMDTNVKFYTCHCTGIESYNRLKAVMGDNIDYLSAGSEIRIPPINAIDDC
ncbi:MBL fold metallo-hydrolase [Acetivibrio mesophilus]|uniref:MBL fold metallo-hydrolase n=1 Tax=Acetivibrio mesophilus TaxID=2487273 RepID=A0A4Q0I803_9FIRM|nr:MBL fold metallo-hydrolase [Acetivibrio mesophilus]RXE60553.1 MBL fold metallo-hydrolase [Acetivibrio mesophilus]